jgi:hypothetical protein
MPFEYADDATRALKWGYYIAMHDKSIDPSEALEVLDCTPPEQ